tara:strand:- start:15 stop:221 length:207 start_codon:yes stop_codon:yes gene_type:complete
MNYKIFTTTGVGPSRTETIHGTTDNLADAVALTHKLFKIVDLEIDALNPRCADFYTACNLVGSIEPFA